MDVIRMRCTNYYANAEYDGKSDPVCPKNCVNRTVGCHNASKCERWAEHERRKAEAYKKRRAEIAGQIRHKVHKD